MARGRVVCLLGLGFGDCGKGLFTDALARRLGARLVVRYNGGAQAGHTVRLPDGRRHTFAQFGAATFQPGVATLLASPVVVEPLGLKVEARCLEALGVEAPLARLRIDPRCLLATPWHGALGRLRERDRGPAAHGTTGLGIGEAARDALERPDEVLRFGDLGRGPRVLEKLEALRSRCLEACAMLTGVDATCADLSLLQDRCLPAAWLQEAAPLASLVDGSAERLPAALGRGEMVLFEGAQGMLLDEGHGFHPHTAWGSPAPRAAEAVLAEAGGADVRHLGILRSYLTRHGPGPLPTEDRELDRLPEPDNGEEGWQGRFRRGHPDGVLLEYAVRSTGGLQGLLVSHLDAFERGAALRWCEAYEPEGGGEAPGSRLEALPAEDLEARARLTERLLRATPRYAPGPLAGPGALVERLESTAGLRVLLASHGPTHLQVEALRPLEI